MGLTAGKQEAAREIMLLCAFEEAREAAAAAGVKVAALKGVALLERGLYLPGERGMTDADVLVAPCDRAAFEKTLVGLGYSPMPDSADAWFRPEDGAAPPAVIDVHTGLWHLGPGGGPGGRLEPDYTDLFLHAAAHPLLHHGELTPRALEDCRRIALRGGESFWELLALKAGRHGLRPVIWPAVSRLGVAPERALAALRPRGAEKIKAAFFEKAAGSHSDFLEYFLPVLHRPGLLLRYAFPGKNFMVRRYGSASVRAYALRPLRLLLAALGKR